MKNGNITSMPSGTGVNQPELQPWISCFQSLIPKHPCRMGGSIGATKRIDEVIFEMKIPTLALYVCLALCGMANHGHAATLHVWQESPNPTPPYADWATAARVIQDAVDAALDGDTVLVTNGIYSAGGKAVSGTMTNRVAVERAITLLSVNGPEETIIVGAKAVGGDEYGNGDGAIRCVYVGRDAVLIGFSLTNGHTRTSGNTYTEQIGGGLWCEDSGSARRCVLTFNSAKSDGGGASGGTLYNCVLAANTANFGGGVFYSTLYNCTVTANLAIWNGGGVSGGILYNCIVYYNASTLGSSNYELSTFYYSCTSPLPPEGDENIISDPMFINKDGGNYGLRIGSPCIDVGTNLSDFITTDIQGKLRPVDGDGDRIAVFDLGAYETRNSTKRIQLHVWQDSPSPTAPYTNWATAAHVIQDAVDAALDGDSVLVTNGIYATGARVLDDGATNRVAVTNAILLCSVNGPSVTTIEGGWETRCVWLGYGGVLSGFSLLNGHTYAEDGGSVWAHASSVVSNCVLRENSSYFGSGGGIYGGTLAQCQLRGNSAWRGGGAASSILINCLLTSNAAAVIRGDGSTEGGGAVESTLFNCTVIDNRASWGEGFVVAGGVYQCVVYNSIVYSNDTSVFNLNHKESALYYSCTIPLPTNGIGNITNDPAFLNTAAGNFHLSSASPCIDAGTNMAGIVINDLDARFRPIDGDVDGLAAYDIGAHEYFGLKIARGEAPDRLILSWPELPGVIHTLEETPTLTPPNWTDSPSGLLNPVTVEVEGQQKCWRLKPLPYPANKLVWIPPGRFILGSPTDEAERESGSGNETQREVVISQGFWMGRHEVTQEEYLEVVGTNPSYHSGTNLPVNRVWTSEVTIYCALLTERERIAGRLPLGYVYRLPTEEEWEYACRAGTTTSHHYGNELRSGWANFHGTREYEASIGTIDNPAGISLGRTTEVGSYEPNAWGLHDMHGNVWEWCQNAVLRGGDYNTSGSGCRSAKRIVVGPDDILRFYSLGFRVVLGDPDPLE